MLLSVDFSRDHCSYTNNYTEALRKKYSRVFMQIILFLLVGKRWLRPTLQDYSSYS
jgi:hypothetical protein